MRCRTRWPDAYLAWLWLAWPAAALAQVPASSQPWRSPAAMAGLDAGVIGVELSSFCSDNCRYDRSGRGSEQPAQNPFPDRWLYRTAGAAVLYDDPGSGVVSRIWLTTGGPNPACLNPDMHLLLYFGDAQQAQIELPLAQVFDGSTPPFTPPLAFDQAHASGGYASYVPIHYAQGLRLAVSGLDMPGPCSGVDPPLLWYQIDALHVPPGQVAGDFALTDEPAALRAIMNSHGEDPWQRGLSVASDTLDIGPGQTVTVTQAAGQGWLAGLRFKLDPAAWSRLRLDIDIDGQSALSLPLDRAFAVAADDAVPARSPLFGLDAQGALYLWWPLPYRQSLAVSLTGTGLAAPVTVQSEHVLDPAAVPAEAGQFHARIADVCGQGENHQLSLLNTHGQGRLVGLAGYYQSDGGDDPRYLEGDVRMQSDRHGAPDWPGSGLEDFYNGGFYFDWGVPYRQAMSGASVAAVHGPSRLWRLMLGDAPVFAEGLELLQEAGASPQEPVPACADTVAFLYQRPERALVPVASVDMSDAGTLAHYAYQAPAGSDCVGLTSALADAGAIAQTRIVCRTPSGQAHFSVHLAAPSAHLQLRRLVDAGTPGQAARVDINGSIAGWFPPVRPDSVRRWQEQDAPLTAASGSTDLMIEIVPLWGQHGDGGTFTVARYELWAVPGDGLFADGFE